MLQNDPKKHVCLSFPIDDYIQTIAIKGGLTNDQVKDYLPHIKHSIAHVKFFEHCTDKNYGFLKTKIEEWKKKMENTEQEEKHYDTGFEEPDNEMMGGRRTLTKRRQHRKSKTLKKTGARK
jgi:hypothetical protein